MQTYLLQNQLTSLARCAVYSTIVRIALQMRTSGRIPRGIYGDPQLPDW